MSVTYVVCHEGVGICTFGDPLVAVRYMSAYEQRVSGRFTIVQRSMGNEGAIDKAYQPSGKSHVARAQIASCRAA